MKTIQQRSIVLRVLPAGLLAVSALTASYTPTASGDDAAYALGGLLAGHLLTDMRMRKQQEAREQQQQTQALNSIAYGGGGAGQPVAAGVPAASAMTPEQKLAQLDKLAAGGYITPAEYKARRTAILDSM
jgi:hypothetical protein